MALKLLYDQYTFGEPQEDPQTPGAFSVPYDRVDVVYNTLTRATERAETSNVYYGGYAGAPAPPQNYSWPVDTPVDAYTVPGPNQPGHVAENEGQYVTVYHEGEGVLLYDFAPVCDLQVKNLLGKAPASGQSTGSVEFDASTSAQWVSAGLLNTGEGPFAPGTPLQQVAPGRLAIQQVPPGIYQISVQDARGCVVGTSPPLLVTVPAAPPAVVYGCMDEDATNFNPLATQSDNSCRYSPRFVGLWSPEGIPVSVASVAGQAYVTGELFTGYAIGHPLAAAKPEAYLGTVRATVSPRTGLAEFDLAPHLRSEVGALLTDGSRRLDINAPTAYTEDLLVGYRLRVGGKPVTHGYALNSVLTEAQLDGYESGKPLSPFGSVLPVWANYPYLVSVLSVASGKYGSVQTRTPQAAAQRLINMPCPRYGLPVAWLTPEGSYGYWVFSGTPLYGDEVGEGQPYTEAGTKELRISSRAPSRKSVEAYTGVYSERAFVEGLRTLRRSVQAWYQPEGPGTAWVAIVLKAGSFPAYREGRRKYEATIQFTEAAPQHVQGQ